VHGLPLEQIAERRYVAIVGMGESVCAASDWRQLVACVARGLGSPGEPVAARLWALSAEGPRELSRFPSEHTFPDRGPRELRLGGPSGEGFRTADGYLLFNLEWAATPVGVLEVLVDEGLDDELARNVAPLVALRFASLAGRAEEGLALSPQSSDAEVSDVIARFADEAKRVLEHDRLSAYLLTPDARAVERFAVATSPTLPGEGVIVPFSDFGLRHILLTNRPLVSEDLATDPRIVGREDRVIAQAGFHGLISVPLRLRGDPFGVLNFVSRTPGFYTEQDASIAQQLADQVSVFFDHLHRERNARAWTRYEVAERERARLARDLHDILARTMPELTGLATDLAERVAEAEPSLRLGAQDLAQRADLVLADVGRALAGLVPPALDSHSLDEVIASEVEAFNRLAGAEATLTLVGETSDLPNAVQRAAYRVLQEALANVQTHAQAKTVAVSLSRDRDLTLAIEDDGVGFDENAKDGTGLGLRFMAERAGSLGGRLSVTSAPGEGTAVVLELLDVHELSDRVESEAPGSLRSQKSSGVSLRVFLVEAQPLLRAGLVRLLSDSGVRVVGTADSVDRGHRQIGQLRPDVVIVDVDQEDFSEGLVRAVRRTSPRTSIVGLSEGHQDCPEQLIEAGAAGVLQKGAGPSELIAGIRTAGEGGQLGSRQPNGSPGPVKSLTAREREVLVLLAAGLTNAEIGRELSFATKTIERQVATIVSKLGAQNRAHAAALAVTRGLVRLPDE
jgi:signal transduction histidine kinase/DNA-binding NarL/FixJ family response regulator